MQPSLKGEKILIPTTLRTEMIQKIHTCHLGVEKTKQRTRNILFWPGMATDIENHIAMCPVCTPKAKSNPKEPLLPHSIPSRPWQKVGVDLFTWNNKSYMVSVDYYSRYFEIDELPNTSSAIVIRKLSAHF